MPLKLKTAGDLRPEQIVFSREAKRVIAFRRNDFAIADPLASRSVVGRFTRHRRVATSHAIARMFVSIFKGELGDSGFVEFAQAFSDHAVVLFLGRAGER